MDTASRNGRDSNWIRGLLDPAAYPHPVTKPRIVETHISWIVLTGDFVYKIKKPVDLGFVNFSTLQRRRFYCEEELRLNRRTAPDLYLDVVPVAVTGKGLQVGREPAVDYAVRMRQFNRGARLDLRLAAGLAGLEAIRNAAGRIAVFHCGLPSWKFADAALAGRRAPQPAFNNFIHMNAERLSAAQRARVAELSGWTRDQAGLLRPVFERRAREGMIRECHGDLHLANLFEEHGEVVPFDCLEFSLELRCIDPVSDVAFLAMDLMAHGRHDLAYALLNGWLEKTGDYAGLAVLRFYLVYRAMVRVKVATLYSDQVLEGEHSEPGFDANQYLGLAGALTQPPRVPLLILMHGFSGSGKTWLSDQLVAAAPLVRVRSDLERKRLHGTPPGLNAAGAPASALYGPDARDATYALLARHCEMGLREGFHMMADATFLDRRHRARFLDLAERAGARPLILHCIAPENALRARIRARRRQASDASDAGIEVLQGQLERHDPLDRRERRITVSVATDTPIGIPGLLRAAGIAPALEAA
jgi:aminoglycoside phosphotransferase family enzyme/predicted kinase